MTLMAERPVMSGTEPRSSFEELLDLLDELRVPDGYKAEITRGSIVVSPWSKAYYYDVLESVCDQLRPYLPAEHRISGNPFLFVFPGSECAYGPDIHAAHRSVSRHTSNRLDGEALSFVAELTSPSTREDDLTGKVEVYAKADVPIYLVLDMQKEQAIVYSSPGANGYEARFSKPFGEKLCIPDPFGCALDTTGFQAPDHEEGD
ncbi:Uma2 family endonuclease [Streptomyces sp. Li-HN-5-11]|uniref:Uma2 family endonuclease n=1 Tax=Streptomyces sp. Li-HN-5-11 TaxID=3075432 RepID=UPI0028AE3867|nr:Uma2 family endonuclease [Streptomyces sp. Li-HN-5-11]WNM29120.1 Uma2 family endonuclease [Streptomyces sp. Li-HN-5-11]